MNRVKALSSALAASSIVLTGCASVEMPDLSGNNDPVVTGAAAGDTTVDSNIASCSDVKGRLAVDQSTDQTWRARYGAQMGISSLQPIVRQIAQQSGCFIVVAAVDSANSSLLDRYRQDARAEGAAPDQGFEQGQREPADYVLVPELVFAEQDCGGSDMMRAGLNVAGGLIPGLGSTRQSVETKCATATLTLWDVRTGVQLGTTSGQGSTKNINVSFNGFSGLGIGAFDTASRTPEGKATLKALVDGYNDLVPAVENFTPQVYEGAKLQ